MNEEKKSKMPIFAERFNALRGRQTQAEFADFLGISRPTVGFYENGERIPDALILKQIAERCGVTTDYLVGLSDNKTIEGSNIAKDTGLSDKAINVFKMALSEKKCYKKYNDFQKYYWLDVLNSLIESFEYFPEFVNDITSLVNVDVTINSWDMEDIVAEKYPDLFDLVYKNAFVISGEDYKAFLIQAATKKFTLIIQYISSQTNPTKYELDFAEMERKYREQSTLSGRINRMIHYWEERAKEEGIENGNR